MRTDKNFSIGLFIIAGIFFLLSIGLFVWAGLDVLHASTGQLWAKVGCGIFTVIVGIPFVIFGAKLIKPPK